jgi:hypothetical protein
MHDERLRGLSLRSEVFTSEVDVDVEVLGSQV